MELSDDDMQEIQRLLAIQQDNDLMSQWSAGSSADLFTAHPFAGAETVTHRVDAFFAGKNGTYVEYIRGPNWIDLWRAADAVIERSGDHHHIFIERFEQEGATLHLQVGS